MKKSASVRYNCLLFCVFENLYYGDPTLTSYIMCRKTFLFYVSSDFSNLDLSISESDR